MFLDLPPAQKGEKTVWEFKPKKLIVKKIHMEKSEKILEIEGKAKQAGITEKRLENDIRSTYLPSEGKFVDYEIIPKNGNISPYIRLKANDGNSISVGTLKAMAFHGSIEDAKFRKVENSQSPLHGKYVLTGTKAVNPHLGGKMAETVANLLDKSFTAEPVELVTMNYDENGYDTEAKAKKALVSKTFYRVKLV